MQRVVVAAVNSDDGLQAGWGAGRLGYSPS